MYVAQAVCCGLTVIPSRQSDGVDVDNDDDDILNFLSPTWFPFNSRLLEALQQIRLIPLSTRTKTVFNIVRLSTLHYCYPHSR
jgi:hypothetical protein